MIDDTDIIIKDLLESYSIAEKERFSAKNFEDREANASLFSALRTVLKYYLPKEFYDEYTGRKIDDLNPIELMDIDNLVEAYRALDNLSQVNIVEDYNGQSKIRCELLSRSKENLVDYILGDLDV